MTESLDKWHVTARNSFVPFCTAMFNNERISLSGILPGDNKQALDKESLTALEGILKEILLQKMITMGGWKKLEIYHDNKVLSKRIWEIDFSIVLSSRVIQWMIFIHNKEWTKASSLEPSTEGDALFFDLVYSQSLKKRRFKINESVFKRSSLTNVLNLKSDDLAPLSNVSTFIPWLESFFVQRWTTAFDLIWQDRRSFSTGIKTQTSLFKKMINDGSVVFFSLLCRWFASITKNGLNRERVHFQFFKSELTYLKDQQQMNSLWLDNLLLLEELHIRFEQCTGVHPVDRSELDKFILNIWAAYDMNRVRDVILSIKNDLNQGVAGEKSL